MAMVMVVIILTQNSRHDASYHSRALGGSIFGPLIACLEAQFFVVRLATDAALGLGLTVGLMVIER